MSCSQEGNADMPSSTISGGLCLGAASVVMLSSIAACLGGLGGVIFGWYLSKLESNQSKTDFSKLISPLENSQATSKGQEWANLIASVESISR